MFEKHKELFERLKAKANETKPISAEDFKEKMEAARKRRHELFGFDKTEKEEK